MLLRGSRFFRNISFFYHPEGEVSVRSLPRYNQFSKLILALFVSCARTIPVHTFQRRPVLYHRVLEELRESGKRDFFKSWGGLVETSITTQPWGKYAIILPVPLRDKSVGNVRWSRLWNMNLQMKAMELFFFLKYSLFCFVARFCFL